MDLLDDSRDLYIYIWISMTNSGVYGLYLLVNASRGISNGYRGIYDDYLRGIYIWIYWMHIIYTI